MESKMSDEQLMILAERRVKARRGLYWHTSSYIIINALLVWINLSYSPEYFWAKWPIIGWGIAIIFHVLEVVFTLNDKGDSIQKEFEKLKNKKM